VVSPEGLPLAYEVVAGNRTDVTTVEEIVTALETKDGQAQRIWVMDRGMVSEDNIELLRACGAQYVVGTPKAQLRQFEAALLLWHKRSGSRFGQMWKSNCCPIRTVRARNNSASVAAWHAGRRKRRCWLAKSNGSSPSCWRSIPPCGSDRSPQWPR